MRHSRWVSRIPIVMGCALLMAWSTQAFAASASSCVKCHLDEDMLTDNLAEVKSKASAMQSGAG